MSTSIKRFTTLVMTAVMLLSLAGCGGLLRRTARTAIQLAPIKIAFVCIPEGTPVDTPDGPRPIQSILPGDVVIGFEGKPVVVQQKHGYDEDPAVLRFLHVEFENGAVVDLCDMHRIDGVRAGKIQLGDVIGGQTVRSVEWFSGVERSYDLLTDDAGYRISGLPVNSMIEEMIAAAR